MKKICLILFPVIFLMAGNTQAQIIPEIRCSFKKSSDPHLLYTYNTLYQNNELEEQDSNDIDISGISNIQPDSPGSMAINQWIPISAKFPFFHVRFLHSLLIDLPPPIF